MAASSKNPPCAHEDINSIFLNSETVLFLHQIFLKGLTARMESWPTLVLGTSLGGEQLQKVGGSSCGFALKIKPHETAAALICFLLLAVVSATQYFLFFIFQYLIILLYSCVYVFY
jgi:hypothetical protein